jgi:hypothetical protein
MDKLLSVHDKKGCIGIRKLASYFQSEAPRRKRRGIFDRKENVLQHDFFIDCGTGIPTN